jgi:hypothetical protein
VLLIYDHLAIRTGTRNLRPSRRPLPVLAFQFSEERVHLGLHLFVAVHSASRDIRPRLIHLALKEREVLGVLRYGLIHGLMTHSGWVV